MEKIKLNYGDVVAWASDTWSEAKDARIATTIIAVAIDESEFVVALNYHEEGRIWEWDQFPEGAKLRKADTIEIGYLLARLMEEKYTVSLKDGGIERIGDHMFQEEDVQLSSKELRSWQFNQYIIGLIHLYNKTHSLSGMSKVRDRHHCTAITKEQFFSLDLDKKDATKYYYPRDYTDAIYRWVTGKSDLKPVIK